MKFTVYGLPVPKQRPRWKRIGDRVITYTPARTAQYEELVAWSFYEAGGKRTESTVKLKLTAFMQVPVSWSKKRRTAVTEGIERPKTRPDLDNLIKSVMDGLNGIAYDDDKQVVMIEAEKVYGNPPRVEVEITEV